ncbi:MAG: Co2+/Mg2+ efflux protein ApaG [Planctomycetota bacterium]
MDMQDIEIPGSVEPGTHGSETVTPIDVNHGQVRIRVRPHYLPQRSDPMRPMHVFAYAITIEHAAPSDARPVQVVDRQWRIIDAHGDEEFVEGEGVVGQQPVLRPGERFEYASYCPLRTSWGTMEGKLGVVTLDDADQPAEKFLVDIDRFYLVSE